MKKLSKIFKPLIFNHYSKKVFFLLLTVLIIGTPILYLFLINAKTSSAAWFDDNWAYRQAVTVTVTSSGSDITNLQTLITVNTSALISASKLQSSCQDLRFISQTSGNSLPYYIDSGCNTTTTKIWVLADLVPKNTTTYTMYMYYGNPTAIAGSNVQQFNLFNGLVGYWTMNESSWNGTSGEVKDSSVNVDNGTSVSSATTTTGKYGNAGSFNGSNYVAISDGTVLDLDTATSEITLSAWIKTSATNASIFGMRNTTNDPPIIDLELGFDGIDNNGTGQPAFMVRDNNNAGITHIHGPTAINDNTWHHVVATRNSSKQLTIYVDGIAVATGTDTMSTGVTTNDVRIGDEPRNGSITNMNGLIDEARVYNRALSATEVTQLYNATDAIQSTATTTSKPTTSFGSEEKGPGPIAYWKFDEGYGTTANDSTQQNNVGTLSGMSSPSTATSGWQTEDQCIAGKCLWFDGANDSVEYSGPKFQTSGTISFWAKPSFDPVTDSTRYYIFDSTLGNRYLLYSRGPNLFGLYINSTQIVDGGLANLMDAYKWNFITITWDNSAAPKQIVYKNGIQFATFDVDITSATPTNFWIGKRYSDQEFWKGFIDEFKIYPYARSAAQVKADYAAGLAGAGAVKGTSIALGGSSDKFLSDGLVGYWKMDESSWTNDCSTTSVTDSSGNGNNGKACPASTGPTGGAAGKFGSAGSFDGSNDYVDAGNASSMNPSVMSGFAWINPNSTPANNWGIILARWGSGGNAYHLSLGDGTTNNKTKIFINTSSGEISVAHTGTLSLGTWHHVGFTYDGATLGLYVDGVLVNATTHSGNISTSTSSTGVGDKIATGFPFKGTIDEARIYNRALSPAEVKALYEWAPGPVGYWKFDENSGTSVADVSGNGNTGTWQGTLGSQWKPGKYGASGNFNGSNNYVSLSQNFASGNLSAFTYEGWVNMVATPDSNGVNLIGFTGNHLASFRVDSTNVLRFLANGNDGDGTCTTTSANASISFVNSWNHIAYVFGDNGKCKFYLNGVLLASGTSSGALNFTQALPRIGGQYNVVANSSKIDDVRIYNYARTQKQIVEDMNAGHPAVGSPVGSAVGHWKFDEGYGTTANNSGNGGSALNGTLSGMASPATSTSGWTNSGKFGKALLFDGSGDYINKSSSSLTPTSITVSAWFKPTSLVDTGGIVSAWWWDRWGSIRLRSTGAIQWAFLDSTTTDKTITSATGLVSTGNWYHFVATFDKTTQVTRLYLNGVVVASGTSPDIERGSNTNFYIGTHFRDSAFFDFNGTIDDVRLYNYALTAEEVKTDYNRGAAQVLGALGDNTSYQPQAANQEYCVPGDSTSCAAPVGSWDFETGTGSTVFDRSGNANNGTWNGTLGNQWVPGKFGKAGNFNGSNNSVSLGQLSNGTLSAFTYEAWVNLASVPSSPMVIIGFSGNHLASLRFDSDNMLRFLTNGNDGGGSCTTSSATTSVTPGTWNHIVYVWGDGGRCKFYVNGVLLASGTSTGSLNFTQVSTTYIGRGYGGEYLNGQIDQVRVFNYARTPAQIAWDYNKGGPVGWWKFNECQGSVANDSSGNGNTGTITPGASGTYTSVGTCAASSASTMWYNGRNGKYNSSLAFDGTDDYIQVPDSTNYQFGTADFAISAWVKSTSSSTVVTVGKYGGSGNDYWLGFSNGAAAFSMNGVILSEPTATVNDGNWHLMTGIKASGNTYIYVDGKLRNSGTISGSNSPTGYLGIGKFGQGGSFYFPGQIDDVRIYNYALTATQVKNVFNEGSATRFAPVTGSP